MAWIESHQTLKDHPKRIDLSNIMGWDIDVTIGKLHRFWWWCVDYAEDGDLSKHNDARIAGAVGLNGGEAKKFIEAMVQSCWIDRKPYFRIHNWWDYIGRWLQAKYRQSPEKWQRVRDLYKFDKVDDLDNDTNQPTKPTKPTNQAKSDQTKTNLWAFLEREDFKKTWFDYLDMRKAKKKPATDKAQELVLTKLHKYDFETAKEMLNQSIVNSWTDVYELKKPLKKEVVNETVEKVNRWKKEQEQSPYPVDQKLSELVSETVDKLKLR